MDSGISPAIQFLAMEGLSEALDVPRNCEPSGTRVGISGRRIRSADSQRDPYAKKC